MRIFRQNYVTRIVIYVCVPRVKETWSALKDILFPFIVSYPRSTSDLDLLTLNFCCRESDIVSVWILARYVEYTWKHFNTNRAVLLRTGEFFGYLKFKYKSDQDGARVRIVRIPQLV